jgi:hypothetical protein
MGEEGSTIHFGFQSGVAFSKCFIFTLFWQKFLTKGTGFWNPSHSRSANALLHGKVCMICVVILLLFTFAVSCCIVHIVSLANRHPHSLSIVTATGSTAFCNPWVESSHIS